MEKLTIKEQKLVEDNHNLIYSFAHKNHLDLDKWYGVLAIGLCKSAKLYNPSKSKFSTYAYMVMRNEVLGEQRKYGALKRQSVEVSLEEDFRLDTIAENIDVENYVETKDILARFENQDILHLATLGYQQREIAEMLGTTQATVSRKLQKLKKELTD